MGVGLAEGAMRRMTMVSDGSGSIVNPNLAGAPRPTLVSGEEIRNGLRSILLRVQ